MSLGEQPKPHLLVQRCSVPGPGLLSSKIGSVSRVVSPQTLLVFLLSEGAATLRLPETLQTIAYNTEKCRNAARGEENADRAVTTVASLYSRPADICDELEKRSGI